MRNHKHLHQSQSQRLSQQSIFPNGEDLPLFSGGCVVDRSEPYTPVPTPVEALPDTWCDDECELPDCDRCHKEA